MRGHPRLDSPAILTSGTVLDPDNLSADTSVPSELPAVKPLQLAIRFIDGSLGLLYGDAAVEPDVSLAGYRLGGGVALIAEATTGRDAAFLFRDVGERAGLVKVGAYDAALLHGDEMATGRRAWGLYWSDGTTDYNATGEISPQALIRFVRSIYCS